MRQKIRASHRRREPLGREGTSEAPARWLLVNEAGWGVPHGLAEMLAALLAGYLVVGIRGWIAARLLSRRN